jgi:hypothetical protein
VDENRGLNAHTASAVPFNCSFRTPDPAPQRSRS